ncbi:MAG TPA: NAD(P)/FAD-dependent oxidoreductase [Pseudonocardiaceae bacterium]|jgi:phytoene dehydrogenase-like protein|nr:NAD(P)/FAD-dependent oxidoreductase [Pseudonocardiaceae bacterium]
MSERERAADAVVVGAGPNGLVAANLLADAGWDVLVLEAADRPGGAVRTEEVVAPGYRSDLFSAFYPFGRVSPILRGLELERFGLRWRRAPAALAHLLPDDECAVIAEDVDRTAESVAAFAPGDGDAWREEFQLWHQVREALVAAILTPFPPVRAATRLARRLGVGDGLRFARMAALPARTFGQQRFTGEGAQLLLAGNALHTDLGPGHSGGALFGWLLCMLAQDVGFPVPVGGAGALTDALVARLTTRGGRIECGRPVELVRAIGGRAVGVVAEDGEPIRARRAVLATVPAPTLYLHMLEPDQLPARLLADMRRFRWDDATVKIDWALAGPIPWTNPAAAEAGTVHLGADLAGLAGYSASLAGGRLPRAPFLVLGQMATADPSRAPEGGESVWAYTHVPRGLNWSADRLRRCADRIQSVVERHAPGFGERVVGRRIQGPQDLERADANLVEGAINGGSAALDQQLFFRPGPGLGRADTPVDRLFLAGASAHPGGAVHGGPGANAARAALVRDGVGGSVYAALIRRAHARIYAGQAG